MSATGAVLFPTGKIGWFEMHTIVPGWYSTVYADYRTANEHWYDKAPRTECHCGEAQRITLVQLTDGYWYWPAVACETCLQFLGACSMEGQEEVVWDFKRDGVPDWFEKALRRALEKEKHENSDGNIQRQQ
jgi:hypothetical protein